MGAEDRNHALIREELTRVLSSSGFARNERLSRFLRFLIERHLDHRDEEIKESLIGIEVFGRRPDYDPKLDSIVRTEAARLRARLLEYYADAGSRNTVTIEVPKGAYRPVIRNRRQTKPPHRRWLSVALAGCAAAAITIGWLRVRANPMPVRMAVLPLENLSPDRDSQYFADGLTDELISSLSAISGLEVRSRTSSFAVQEKPRNIHLIAKELDVDYILEGSVTRATEHVRIDVRLIRVRDDVAVWLATFDRPLADVIAVQDDISRGIVNNLRLHLGRRQRQYEISVDAYDLYLRGRALSQQNHPLLFQSIPYFQKAITADPSFAPAYAALASMYAFRSVQFALDHPDDELPRMRAAAETAIRLDPLLAEAHDALGMIHAHDSRWQQAEEDFRHSIELDPSRSATHFDFGTWLLWVLGRNEEAIQQLRLAQNADPLSPLVRIFLGFTLISAERYEEAAVACSGSPAGTAGRNLCLARARFGQGHAGDAIRLMTDSSSSELNNPETRGFLGYFYARAGRREEAAALANASHYANEQALIYAGLEDKERTLEALERMRVLSAQRVGIHLNYPEVASVLRGDPRLPLLRERVGLPR
jgi:serine/threonine-protein kinase